MLLLAIFLPAAALAQAGRAPAKAKLPPVNEIWMDAVTQESNNGWRYLRGAAKIETTEMTISADQIDYNDDTHWAYARGHVRLEHFATGDVMNADHAEYNLETEEGRFYVVDGTAPAKIISSPWVLSTTNPFYFKARWAERIKNRYILHNGFVTDCKMPKPWWKFEGPRFDIIPGQRAIARNPLFMVWKVPIIYLPYLYRPLGRNPRQSGFLTPNFGHSTLFGYIYGLGYYWAMNRSYDMTGVGQYFTLRGPALMYDFRGKPNDVTDFNFNLYSVFDQGVKISNTTYKEGGTEFEFTGRTSFWGFNGRADINYLSSFVFRQAFSYSFATAISSEVGSIAYLQRHFENDEYALYLSLQRDQFFEGLTYQSICQPNSIGKVVCAGQTPNQVVIQKLPYLEFSGRDHQLSDGPLPLWFSFQSTAGLFTREEPTGTVSFGPPSATFETGPLGRLDVEPRVATNFQFKGFSLTPSITLGATDYTNSYVTNTTSYVPVTGCGYAGCTPVSTTKVSLAGNDIFRKDADFVLDFRPPSLERVFTPPKWLHLGQKIKHVIEAEATYEDVTGVNQFQKIIHFDQTDILSNTNQLTAYLTNRLYRKDKAGNVSEFLTWRVSQAHYFDPTFGGAVVAGQRNVVLATDELMGFAFLDGPRSFSPVVSTLSLAPYNFFSVDLRADFDPMRHKFVDEQYGTRATYRKYFVSLSDNAVSILTPLKSQTATGTSLIPSALLAPDSNQISFGGGYGNTNRTGINLAATVLYDLGLGRPLFEFIQASYNSNCCGFSFELRRFDIGIRNENQYLFSFSVANIGTFGSLQHQGRIF